MVRAYHTKKEKRYKKNIYDEMQMYPDENAVAVYHERPYYIQAPYVQMRTVFEDITESPKALADFIYHNQFQLRFNSVSEVVLFLNRRNGGK